MDIAAGSGVGARTRNPRDFNSSSAGARIDARERHAKRRRHRRADRFSIQRIGARPIEQNPARAQRQRHPEQAADVVGIPDPFQCDQSRRSGEGIQRKGRRRPVRQRQAAAMEIEPRHGLEHRWIADEDRNIGQRFEQRRHGAGGRLGYGD